MLWRPRRDRGTGLIDRLEAQARAHPTLSTRLGSDATYSTHGQLLLEALELVDAFGVSTPRHEPEVYSVRKMIRTGGSPPS
ncbi:MAG: hypothetical protein ACRDX8_12945 [Acidimicrobiales bacterium]